jgi:hypothetical protein
MPAQRSPLVLAAALFVLQQRCGYNAGLQQQAAFMRWFSRAVLASLYPGAPFERKFLAMLMLDTLLGVWSAPDKAVKYSTPGYRDYKGSMTDLLALARSHDIQLLCPGFLGPKTVQVRTALCFIVHGCKCRVLNAAVSV